MPEQYSLEYTAVLIITIAGIGMVLAAFFASMILAPRSKSEAKQIPYECGIPPTGQFWAQLHLRYYIFAILFLIFDVEAAFLFPWARVLKEAVATEGLGGAALLEGLLFTGILVLGLAWVWAKGDLDWVRSWKPSPPEEESK